MARNCIEHTFYSVTEFGEHVRGIMHNERTREASSDPHAFKGTTPHLLEEAIDIACNGGHWEEGARELQKVDVTTDAGTAYESRVMVNDMVGFTPNVPAHLAGHPLSMFNHKMKPSHKKLIRIGVGISMRAGVKATDMYNRGRAVVAAVDSLITQGYGVEIWGVAEALNGNQRIKTSILVKPSDGAWSTGIAAFMLACSSVVRRLHFRMREDSARYIDNGCYGGTVAEDTTGFDVWFPGMTHNNKFGYSKPYRALATVQAALAAHTDTVENAA